MPRIMIEDGRIDRPVFIELRGKLDEVPGGCCPGKRRIPGVGKHTVQRMAKLMKHRDYIIEADESRLTGGGLRQVGDVVDDGEIAQEFRRTDEQGHPCTAILVVALEIIAIKQRQGFAVDVGDFEDAHVGLIYRDVLALFEADSIQLSRRMEHAVLEHVVQLEVRLDLGVIEIILCLAHLFAVEIPIPRLQREATLLCVDHGLNVLGLACRFSGGDGHQGVHEFKRGLRCFGHLIFQLPRGMAGKAQQLRPLRAKLRQPRNDGPRIVRVTAFRAVP